MNAEILCVGTELLIGDIVNTNAAYISAKLSEIGINVYYHSVCGDNRKRLTECLKTALSRADLVVMTGGLGPTYDDITKETVCECLGLTLEEDPKITERLEKYFAARGRQMTDNNRKQALVPRGARIFENAHGTADGLAVVNGEKTVILMPGPPREMKPMLDNQVIPYLSGNTDHVLVSSNVYIYGMGESSVENALKDLMRTSVNPTVAPYVDGGVRLRVTASAADSKSAKELIQPVVKEIRRTLGSAVYSVDEPRLEAVVVEKLKEKGKTVAFAESCTGGLISKRITDVPGSSAVFGYGFCTYANEAKTKILGVKRETLDLYGAVSPQTAEEMAKGALEVSGADIAVSVTGIAGPDGGTEEKPVGLVYMGIACGGRVQSERLMLGGHSGSDRDYIRMLTANTVFKAVLDLLETM